MVKGHVSTASPLTLRIRVHLSPYSPHILLFHPSSVLPPIFLGSSSVLPCVKVCFNPQGTKILTASSDKSARIWEVETGDCLQVQTEHLYNIQCSEIFTLRNEKLDGGLPPGTD